MRRRRKRRRSFSKIASLKIHRRKRRFDTKSGSSFDDVNDDVIKNEEEDACDDEAFLESGFEVSLECVFSKASTPSVAEEEEEDEEEEEEEEEFAVRLSYAFDISNALVRSRLGTMMITNDKSEENNNKDKDKEVLKTMVFTLKEERFSSSSNEQKGDVSAHVTLSVDAHEMQKILERVPLRVKENTACVFVETMKREDDNSKKYIVDDRLTVVAKHFRCEETGKLKRQFVNPFV
tara:strand:+ start:109 stop:813 length:705 start_codon:yes stop_codon:yes gene_type:complete